MTVYERVVRCRLIEKMGEYPDYSERLGLEDVSRLEGLALENVSGLIEMGLKDLSRLVDIDQGAGAPGSGVKDEIMGPLDPVT